LTGYFQQEDKARDGAEDKEEIKKVRTDSGSPTSDVVNTASPDTVALAPNDLPWKMGPSCPQVSQTQCHMAEDMP
jgi:hypothetical protein